MAKTKVKAKSVASYLDGSLHWPPPRPSQKSATEELGDFILHLFHWVEICITLVNHMSCFPISIF
jgi:hypothetical protein